MTGKFVGRIPVAPWTVAPALTPDTWACPHCERPNLPGKSALYAWCGLSSPRGVEGDPTYCCPQCEEATAQIGELKAEIARLNAENERLRRMAGGRRSFSERW